MSITLRALRIEVSTPTGLFGMATRLSPGLVVLRADNTSGKSTCVQAIIWALGLEGMYGPTRVPPLTPAVMTQIADCGVRRIRPPSSAESDQSFRLNPTTQFGVSDHLGESQAAA